MMQPTLDQIIAKGISDVVTYDAGLRPALKDESKLDGLIERRFLDWLKPQS